MVKEKKNFNPFKGNKVNQKLKNSKFVEEFNTWRDNCQKIGNADLYTKNVPNLYMFLKRHFVAPFVRAGSRNKPFEGEGANELLTIIEKAVDDDLFTVGNAKIIKQLATVLKEYKDTGEDAGGEGIAADPAFILFTEKVTGRGGQKLRDRTIQGHYNRAAPKDWFAGNNAPHQALFSETSTKFAKPRGLLYIMQDATEEFDNRNTDGFADLEVEVDKIPDDFDASDFEEISAIEQYFDNVVRNEAFWNSEGKLLVDKLRRDFQAQSFRLKEKDQQIIRELARLGKRDDPNAIAGKVTEVRLTATALPLLTLVDRALKRKGTNKAPNGKPAWQDSRRGGFDYREKGEEAVVFNVSSIRVARELAKIPQIKRFAQGLLKKTSLFDEEDFKTSQAGRLLADKKFDLSPSQKKKVLQMFDKEDTNPKTIQFKLTKGAMKALLNQSVISRTRDLQTMNAPNTDKKIVLKSMWQMALWRR
tara:strand:- start:301 stop:1722 length:1422 start_codon:yes stop_codon:yes gene_type:complete